VFGPSACARAGSETKVAFGSGVAAFAFAWDTDHYVVVYPDASSGGIFAGRLAADGGAMGTPQSIQTTQVRGDLPGLLGTAGGYLVTWEGGSAGNAIYLRPLGHDAAPSGDEVTVAATRLQQARPVVARAPRGRVALAWMDQFEDGSQGAQVALIDPSSLQVTGQKRVGLPDVAGWPWVAGDDQSLAVVWRAQATQASGTTYDIPFATVNADNLELSVSTSLRGIGTSAANLPRMIRTTNGFLGAWEDQRGGDNEIFMAVVDDTGAHVGGGLVEEPGSGDANWPNMAWTGRTAGVVYYQWRESRPQIFMSFVDGAGMRVAGLHDLQVSNGTGGWSKYPDVAYNGSEFAVMYVDTRDGAPALWFQRVGCRG
jgi:hypothetical protein